MESKHRKTSNSQVKTIQGINWDDVEKDIEIIRIEPIPENAITIDKIATQFNVGIRHAACQFNKLLSTGKYELFNARTSVRHKTRYLIKKK